MRLTLAPGGDIAALVRGVDAESRVVIMSPTLDPLAMAQARAAIGPLAVELAPDCRVNAICVAVDGDPAHVDAAVDFIEQARSTTGQILDIG